MSVLRHYRIRDLLPHGTQGVFDAFRHRRDTFCSRLLARWWGIEIGRGCQFYGTPIFRRGPGSTVRIGDGCVFRSAEWSNTIGLNRRCVLASAKDGRGITIGRDCGLSGTVISAGGSVTLGDRVFCGANCTITDDDRHPLDPAARANEEKTDAVAVVIDDDVWLGMNVVVLKGVRIGSRTVVAANSVVTKSLPGGVLAGGIPARVIRKLDHTGEGLCQ